ncbi:MAG: NAD(P)/FAD-dependent oxidoreductase [Gammaproteobacteria bacterium]|nr:NAD(P)/FAD-dependent oxidoreductase [Gammaproteobacteria bacterium]
MEILTDSPVAEIRIANGRAQGVALENGDEYSARVVVSNAAPGITFRDLIDARHLPETFLGELGRFRSKGSAFKINLAMEQPPRYRGFDPQVAGIELPAYAHIGPTTAYLERAFDEAKYGGYSSKPFISPITPSLIDDSLAPAGKHVVTLYGGVAPYDLEGTSWEAEKDRFVQIVLDTMEDFAPGFSDSIIAMDAMVPPDIERILNIPGGHELHGDCAVDQLFMMRPVPGYADYRSPIRNLYQCGASTHPGGAVSCVPGHNAAREILSDWRSRKPD